MPSLVIIDGKASQTFNGSAAQAGSVASFTFLTVPFGSVTADRLVAIALSYLSTNTVSGVTIGGIAATKVLGQANASSHAEIWVAAVPTGTTGTVVVSGFNAAGNNGCAIQVYSLYGLSSSTPSSTGTAIVSPFTAALATVGGGVSIGVYGAATSGATAVWSGLTEQTDATISISGGLLLHYTSASVDVSVTGTLTATATITGVASTPAFVAAAWAP